MKAQYESTFIKLSSDSHHTTLGISDFRNQEPRFFCGIHEEQQPHQLIKNEKMFVLWPLMQQPHQLIKIEKVLVLWLFVEFHMFETSVRKEIINKLPYVQCDFAK